MERGSKGPSAPQTNLSGALTAARTTHPSQRHVVPMRMTFHMPTPGGLRMCSCVWWGLGWPPVALCRLPGLGPGRAAREGGLGGGGTGLPCPPPPCAAQAPGHHRGDGQDICREGAMQIQVKQGTAVTSHGAVNDSPDALGDCEVSVSVEAPAPAPSLHGAAAGLC